jgi:hypothetical protein
MRVNTMRARALRLNRVAAAVLAAMRTGQSLHLEFRQTGPRWSLSNGRPIDDRVARLVIINTEIIAENDALFPNITMPQTFYLRRSL